MKEVKFLTDTAYRGPRKVGETISVPDDFAKRWAKNGIAEIIDANGATVPLPETDEKEPVNVPGEGHVDDGSEENENKDEDYSKMNAKELFTLCKERGLEVEPKKSKEYYIEKLTSN